MKSQLQNLNIAPPLAFAALLLLTIVGVAYAATNQQGYTTGCSIGSDETYYSQNWALFNATLDMAYSAHEYAYAEGVEGGYYNCRFVPQQTGGRGVGTTCDINGCE